MEKLAYKCKDYFANIKNFFTSDKVMRIWHKIMKYAKIIVPKILIYVILISFAYIFMAPLLRVLIDSLKTKEDILNPDIVWIPTALTGKNYKSAFTALFFFRIEASMDGAIISSFFNSTFFSLLAALFQTVVSCLAGYAFARFNFKGKKLWFAGLIIAFIIPTQLLTIPRRMMLQTLMNATSSPSHLFNLAVNTPSSNRIDGIFSFVSTTPILLITLLGQGINSSILIFIAFSFFKMIPVALDEAAQIDGANFLQIFYHVILKMSIPTILVIFLFSFVWNWNDTYSLTNLTALADSQLSYKSLPEALSQFNLIVARGEQASQISSQDQESNNAGLKSAAIIISILPLLILYAFAQKRFVEGIENTGVTGV